MEFNINHMAEEAIRAINERVRNLKHLNIAVVGKTGAGKSTLINSVFRENLVETGIGKPVTSTMRKISKEGFPLSIYDTPGFELGEDRQKTVRDELIGEIRKGIASKDIDKAIHCVWYCINANSNRIEPKEIEWLREFAEENNVTQVPVIIVLTQGFLKSKTKAMKKAIEAENLDVIGVVPVLAQELIEEDDEETIVYKSYGLDILIELMSSKLPNELRDTLQNVQKASLESKKKYAQAAVAAAVTAAFGEGFTPVPFADAAMLVPTQIAMIASITAIFGLEVNKSIITGFVSSTVGTGGATVLGRTVVSNIMKLIPGVGTAVGGAISGATAGLITTALGEAYIKLMEMMYKGEIGKDTLLTSDGQAQLTQLFKDELKKKK